MNQSLETALQRVRQRRASRQSKTLMLPIAGLFLACASCSEPSSDPAPPPVTVTDTTPIGEGLKLIGFAMLGAAVVGVLGRMLK